MIRHNVARVAFESPLPQLDKLFDYAIPTELLGIVRVGQRVEVPFGKSSSPKQGYVIETTASSDFDGRLSHILRLVSKRILLPPNTLRLCQLLATRQALTFGELLKTAAPDVMLRVDKNFDESLGAPTLEAFAQPPQTEQLALTSLTVMPGIVSNENLTETRWIIEVVSICQANLAKGLSTLLCVPDYRDINRLEKALTAVGIDESVVTLRSEDTKSEKYARHLECLSPRPRVVLGSRAALFAPLQNIGTILVWDEADPSHHDEGSPYLNSRDVALVRQSVEKCSLIFMQHFKSAAITRLEQIGFLKPELSAGARPEVSFSTDSFRVDSLAHKTIKSALARGSVLVQVAAKGSSSSLRCEGCSSRSTCSYCSGPLWENERNQIACRVCSGFNLQPKCRTCGSHEIRRGRAGTTRTLAEFGKSFPGVRLAESTASTRMESVSRGSQLVVASPGAEPFVEGGYAAVVFLDGETLLSRDSLNAAEQTIRTWANSLGLLAPGGKAVFVDVPKAIGQSLSLWQLDKLSSDILAERVELGFPPSARVLSVTGSKEDLKAVESDLRQIEGVRLLGISSLPGSTDERLVAAFSYSAGSTVAKAMRAAVAKTTLAKRFTKSGRPQRALTVKMDDPQVL